MYQVQTTPLPLPWREGIKPARHRPPEADSGEAGGGRGITPTFILPRQGGGEYSISGWALTSK